MKLFKNPFVAVLLSLLMVISSTLISTNIKLGRRCEKISDGFYEGVIYNGSKQKSISSNIKTVCGSADELAELAKSYDLDSDNLKEAAKLLRSELSTGNISDIYSRYFLLLTSFNKLSRSLSELSLSESDALVLEQNTLSFTDACRSIDESGYNQSVREFYREELRFPADILGRIAGVELPQLFE